MRRVEYYIDSHEAKNDFAIYIIALGKLSRKYTLWDLWCLGMGERAIVLHSPKYTIFYNRDDNNIEGVHYTQRQTELFFFVAFIYE